MISLFQYPEFKAQEAERAKLLWIVRLRWLATGVFFFLSIPALLSGLLSRDTMPLYLGIIGVLLIFNLLTRLTVVDQKRVVSPLWTCLQLSFDLAMLTLLLLLTGGFANPFIGLFLLHASLGGFLIRTRLSIPFVLLSHTALIFLQLKLANEEPVSNSLFASFMIYHFLTFSFWLVFRTLGAHLENQSIRESKAQEILETQDRLRAVGALAAGFSHEFASPLNSAKIRLERILRKDKTEDATEALAAIGECETIVRQMNSSQLDPAASNMKDVKVGELIQDVVESWQEDNPQAEIKLNVESAETGTLPVINFAQVILNLLDNAYESAPEKEIVVQLTSTTSEFVLNVKDLGAGFERSILARVGQPFVTTKPQGTGLGLYVTELFCQSLGGSLSVANLADGAMVSLHWPKNEARA